ncbi:competence/damage-inducible protein A [Kamptonema animale CS-326]|jgi:nicotinamide-nucleotide amidase|uniref:competence/damage-inducible protein A n=1 Tax=Kamptonema animale TaxID=92934 RepID=UPI00232AEF9B|nr:competence/damage-inducible protein A [Kamptonema animale]MDB9511252.1 competence/damage-inducible protein A [Kamptonema animale CS-326]
MVAEIICVGTELLLGDILNSNAQFLAQQLASLGIPHYYQTVVGDNPERIKQVLEMAMGRSQILLFTGGLGPTPDDLTVETIADFFGVPLTERPEIIADIEQKFAQRGRVMSPSNRKQALIPVGADILPNSSGSAPGIIWQPRPNVTIMTFPGVPAEMHLMWQETAVPYLRSHGWCSQIIYSRTLRFWGITESALAEKVNDFFNLANPTVAPYANHGEVKLRISARAESAEDARTLILPVEEQLRQIAGLDCYGADSDSLASVVGQLLLDAGETLAVAESCTGGGLGAMLTSIAGSSSYFLGGIISYDNRVKVGLLDVNPEDLAKFGAVSRTVAKQMAAGVRSRLETTYGLSITGIAGPGGGSEDKPVGLVYIGLAGPSGEVEAFKYRFGTLRDRNWIRNLSACTALDQLRRKLLA